jgi:GNAT superfamily N-acetyltransferase
VRLQAGDEFVLLATRALLAHLAHPFGSNAPPPTHVSPHALPRDHAAAAAAAAIDGSTAATAAASAAAANEAAQQQAAAEQAAHQAACDFVRAHLRQKRPPTRPSYLASGARRGSYAQAEDLRAQGAAAALVQHAVARAKAYGHCAPAAGVAAALAVLN